MGGNALKEYGAKRVEASEYHWIASKLSEVLDNMIKSSGIEEKSSVIRAYRNKPSFGDIDIIVPTELHKIGDANIAMLIASGMNTDKVVFKSNGPVTSFGLPLFSGGLLQIDLIYTKKDDFNFANEYYSWNDLGNLIGRIAHKLGLRFGHDGLSMPLRDGDNLFDTIHLTKDFKTAIEFLGYSYRVHQYGFDTMEDIFRFTVDTDWFNSAIYDLDNRNHTARVRDKKRPTYTAFLEWLKVHPEVDKHFEFPKDKSIWHETIWTYFPAAKTEFDAAMARLERRKLIKSKFNGDIVRELTGLEGKDLGMFMRKLVASMPDFDEWVLRVNEGTIKQMIEAEFRNDIIE